MDAYDKIVSEGQKRSGAGGDQASAIRRRFNRFKPRREVEWLDHDARSIRRQSIKLLTTLAGRLEKQESLTPEQDAFLYSATESQSLDTRINWTFQQLEKTTTDFAIRLAEMAPYDLSAYHELMRPNEPPARHHLYLCDLLQRVEAGEIKTLVISLPPGTAKSTYTSRSFAQWFMGLHPDRRVLAIANTQKFAEDELSKPNRDAIQQDEWKLAFPDVEINPDVRSASFWRLENWKGSYACRGAGAGAAGLRANLILADDLYKNAEDALSATVQAKIWRWWTADIMSRMLPDAPMILVNTRWHSHDVAGEIETMWNDPAKRDGVSGPCVIVNIPAQCIEEDKDPLGRKEGEWIWPEFYSAKHWEIRRNATSPTEWSSLYMGQPLDKFGEYIAEDEFKRYDQVPQNKPNAPVEWVKTVMSTDTAAKGQDRSDYTVMLIFRVRPDGTHCLVDCWRGKKRLEEVMGTMNTLMKQWAVDYCIVEDSGMGMQILENYAGKTHAPLLKYTPSGKGSKAFRFDPASKWIISGRVQLPKQASWLNDFMTELIAFPNGDYDDQVDAFSQYCDYELKYRIGGTKKLQRSSG